MEISLKHTNKTSDSETTNNNITHHPKPQSLIPSSFNNNKHHQLTYKECLKNHAASIGGHALDGCGEFMPTTDSNSLKCAVCDCHRNFHRQEPDDQCFTTPHFLTFHHHQLPSFSHHSPPHMLARDERKHHAVVTPATPSAENVSTRKRFRTKFSQQQKDKMHIFSEKIGWRMQKSDQVIVEEFCKEIGVGKSVLKIWMHNNKTTLGKREISNTAAPANNNIVSTQNNIGLSSRE
ncbi:zinc-finger homeodomain protein 2-like [Apium graveolens]|uniref:zinc-finger homeodomain protein 2-like n=1 Tax=Apium graveolens TaxID=4045 RepID=UPI003D79E56C